MMKKSLWNRDRCLRNCRLDKYKIVSIDVFDTLLFRTVSEPEEIFRITCERAVQNNMMDRFTDSQVFCHVRMYAEYSTRCLEQKLEDIYSYMTAAFSNCQSIMQIELETEKQNSYINESIKSLIYDAHNLGIRVILVSDMYLTGTQIKDMLEYHNFDTSVIGDILVSSEVGCSKYEGKLYEYILHRYEITDSKSILHIGDNFEADYIKAREHGYCSIYYDIIRDHYLSKFELEKEYNGGMILPDIMGLRKLAAALNPYSGKNYEEWYEMGATIIGPFLAIMCDYLSDYCIDRNIKYLYPIMREGAMFAELLSFFFELKEYDIEIQKFYASRRSTFLAGMDRLSSPAGLIENLKYLRTLMSLLVLLGLDPNDERIASISNITSKEIFENPILLKKVMSFFNKNDVKEKIIIGMREQRHLLEGYLRRFKFDADYAFLDMGYKGTSMYSILRVLDMMGISNAKAYKLIAISDVCSILRLGNNINRFCNFCEVSEKNYVLLENVMIGNEKSTQGYCKNDQTVEPIMEENNYDMRRIEGMKACRDGIMTFIELYARLDGSVRTKVIQSKAQADKLFERMGNMPSVKEARLINFVQNEDFGQLYNNTLYKLDKIDSVINYINVDKYKDRFGADVKKYYKLIAEIKMRGFSKVVCLGINNIFGKLANTFAEFGIEIEAFFEPDNIGVADVMGIPVISIDKLEEYCKDKMIIVNTRNQKYIQEGMTVAIVIDPQ